MSYAFVIGYGTHGVGKGVAAQFGGDVASASQCLVLLQAPSLASWPSSTRLFALGRERILPSGLARTHGTHRTPHVAGGVLAVAVALYITAFYIDDSSTDAALLKLGTWTPLLGVLGILLVQALVSCAIVRYFLTTGRKHARPLRTLVAPMPGGGLMLFSAYLLIDNRETLAAAEGVPFVQAVPYVIPIVFLVGVAAALWFRARDSARFAAVGRFVHEEA